MFDCEFYFKDYKEPKPFILVEFIGSLSEKLVARTPLNEQMVEWPISPTYYIW